MTVLCVLPGCYVAGQHLTTSCPGGDCRGCVPRPVDRPHVCQPCRTRLTHDLDELVTLAGTLTLHPGSSGGPKVTGTREAPMPVRADVINLVGPGNANVSDPYGDQVGELPLAVWLGEWSMWWGRLDIGWACDRPDAGIDAFSAELRRMLAAVRRAAGDVPERPDYKDGVMCRRCDTKALSQAPGDPYISCGVCGVLYTQDEYDQWTRLLAASARRNTPVPA